MANRTKYIVMVDMTNAHFSWTTTSLKEAINRYREWHDPFQYGDNVRVAQIVIDYGEKV